MKYRNKIKWWRHKLGIDFQNKFAEIIDCTPQQVNQWEKQQGQISVPVAKRISDKLTVYTGEKVYIEDLFEWLP